MAGVKKYMVLASGRIAGVPRKDGDVVELTPAQAKYENVTEVVIGIDLAKGKDESAVATVPVPKTTKRSPRKK